MLKISLILGAIAALADVAGGLVLVRAQGRGALPALLCRAGRGIPDGHGAAGDDAREPEAEPALLGPILIMAGYCVVHLLEHTINAHFHFGEETHTASLSRGTPATR
jgi:hypothetical protein